MVGCLKVHAFIKSKDSVMVDVGVSILSLNVFNIIRMPVVPVDRTYSTRNGDLLPAAQIRASQSAYA